MMVCPDCGSNEFTQQRVALIEYTMTYDHGQWLDGAESVQDGGDRDTDIACADCGRDIEDGDLVTEDAYNEGEDA